MGTAHRLQSRRGSWGRGALRAILFGLIVFISPARAEKDSGVSPSSGCLSTTNQYLESTALNEQRITRPPAPLPPVPPPAPVSQGVAALAQRLGVGPDQATLIPFSSAGGMSEVYAIQVHGSDPRAVVFPNSPALPPGLRGRPVRDYLAKLGRSKLKPIFARRNARVYEALADELALGGSRYEGISLAETHLLGPAADGADVVVQRRVGGHMLDQWLTPMMAKAMGDPALTPARAMELFRVFQEREAVGHSPSEVFAADSFAAIERAADKMGRPAITPPSDAQLQALRALWREPDLVRIRELMARLRALARTKRMDDANAELRADGQYLLNRPPWSSQRQVMWGADFGMGNFHLERGPDGRLRLTLFDY